MFFVVKRRSPTQNVGDIQFLFGKNRLGMDEAHDVSEYVCLVTLLGCPAGI